MIEIHPLRDKEKLTKIYKEQGITMGDNSIAILATDGDEILGSCLFDLDDNAVTIHAINPVDDVYFADGLLRSALHVGVENGKNVAFYSNSAPEKLFETLGFIKNLEKKELNVDKLFSSCQNC